MTAPVFLGCSVVSVNSSAGFNGQISSLQLQLVEDQRYNQIFIAPPIGSPLYFNYSGFTFGGILDSFEITSSTGGRIIDVVLVDPREIMAGVHLILSEYNGATSQVPNVFNIYGYLENTYGFGYSGLTVDGVKWGKVVKGFNELLNNPTSYGGRISYRGNTFSLVLDNLPNIPEDYRISGDISLLDFIIDICETGNCDFLVSLRPGTTIYEIYIKVLSRNTQPSLGFISAFVASVPNATVRRSGLSRVNEINNRMLFGARKRDLNYVSGNIETTDRILSDSEQTRLGLKSPQKVTLFENYDSYDEMIDSNILPYFGLDINRNAIVGIGVGDWMTVQLDMRLISMDGLDNTYTATLGELRAALAGYSQWCMYLWNYCFSEFIPSNAIFSEKDTSSDYLFKLIYPYSINQNAIDPNLIEFTKGENNDNKYFYHVDDDGDGVWKNPHFKKAYDLKIEYPPSIITSRNWFSNGQLVTEAGKDVRGFMPLPAQFKNFFLNKTYSASQLLWSHINKFAEEYYGHKFMIKVDGLEGAGQEDTLDLVFNKNAVDSGYVPEDQIVDAVANNLLPFGIGEFSDNNGLIQAFVRFDNFFLLDTSEMNEGNTFLNTNYKKVNKSEKVVGPPYAFVKCSVEDIVFLDYENKRDPRVVISLPFIPYLNNDLNPQIRNNITFKALNDYGMDNIQLNKLSSQVTKFATNTFNLKEAYIFPDLVAIPMESNQDRYGPWYVVGSDGPTDLITDDNLAPWNYNGYDNMNLVAEAILNDGPASQVVESGSIEVPGAPLINIGDTLIAGGPYVTDVQVNISDAGITTTYRLEIWKPRFGKMNKVFVDKVSRIQRTINQLKTERRGMVKTYLRNPNGNK